MVTAGVYMIARLNFLFALSPAALIVVSGVGAATAFFAATIGFAQRDIKKVLAYSTVSQLGFMFIGVGVGAYTAGVFHLMTHAFFKACLFLGAGSVIHGMSGEQDIFKMGGLRKKMPVTFWTFIIATLAIAGVPGLAGFFSKDEILWRAFDNVNPVITWWRYVVAGLGYTAALCTAFYMFRVIYLTFLGESRASDEVQHHIHESPRTMTIPLVILAGLSIVGGWLGMPAVSGLPNFFEHWLEPVVGEGAEKMATSGAGHGAEWGLMLLSVAVAFTGIWLASRVYGGGRTDKAKAIVARMPLVHYVVYNKYFVDEIYDALVIKPVLAFTRAAAWFDAKVVDGVVNLTGRITMAFAWFDGAIDRYVVDGAVNLVGSGVISFGGALRKVQTGRLQDYLYFMLAGLVLALLLVRVIPGF
jgi:NADH-quinone oxidoreductase subunit L